jgi:xylulokinase
MKRDAMRECFLGIDIGTGSSKGTIVDILGNVVAQASIQHDMDCPHPGWFEQDADGVWWHDFVYLSRTLVDQLRQKALSPSSIRGVAASTIAPCVLPIDEGGKPLRPGILYGIDTRATQEIAEMESSIGREAIFEKTGQQLSSQSCIPKILWIRKNEPQVWAKTRKVLTASGYLVYRLTGNVTVDMYNAIAYAPLFNIREKRWDSTFCGKLFDLSILPEILWSDSPCGRVTKEAAMETGLPAGTPVIAGTADAGSESLAAGVKDPGDMMMMYGSSNFFIMKTMQLRPVASLWASNYLESGTTVLTGGMATVGSMFKWFQDTFPGSSFEELEKSSAGVPPCAHGVTILPYFAGERTPIFDPQAKGVIFGLSLATTLGDIHTAFQESVGYGIRHNLEAMREAGEHPERVIAIGGAAASDQMMQRITDIIGCRQQIPRNHLGACYGDAFLAAVGSGHIKDLRQIDAWVEIEKEFLPNGSLADRYTEGYARYRQVYSSTRHLMR